MADYVTIDDQIYVHETIIQKSRFVAIVKRLHQLSDFNDFLNLASKRYPQATHYCYAILTRAGQKYTDAGEPQGTAGIQILHCIKKQNLTDVAIIVCRYFGGVKLGTGGLARAYAAAAQNVLKIVKLVTVKTCTILTFDIAYESLTSVQNLVKHYGQVVTLNYDHHVSLKIAIPIDSSKQFIKELSECLHESPQIIACDLADVEFK